MTWRLKHPAYPFRPKNRSVDAIYGLIVVVAIIVAATGLDHVLRHFGGEGQNLVGITIGRPTVATQAGSPAADVTVIDGDTVRSGGITYRLVGFDTPERGDRALCDKERELAERAAARLQSLIASREPMERAACACKPGTEGTRSCGGSCAYLKVDGRDAGDILIREGLAQAFICTQTSCPTRRPWC